MPLRSAYMALETGGGLSDPLRPALLPGPLAAARRVTAVTVTGACHSVTTVSRGGTGGRRRAVSSRSRDALVPAHSALASRGGRAARSAAGQAGRSACRPQPPSRRAEPARQNCSRIPDKLQRELTVPASCYRSSLSQQAVT